eukprot:7930955-Pyramimonas_sp.AAC.1
MHRVHHKDCTSSVQEHTVRDPRWQALRPELLYRGPGARERPRESESAEDNADSTVSSLSSPGMARSNLGPRVAS